MATLIPYFVTEKTPFGEKKIFDLIKRDKRTDDWIVFHSLGIEEHRTQFMGEADFVIISPTLGCFVIEVKGGEKICVQDGRWTSTSRDGKVHNIHNPFEQAKNNAFSIMDYLKSQNVGFPRFVYGVAFPETVFSCKSISYAPEQIFDANNNNDFYTYLTKLKNYYGERDRSKDFRPPNKQEMANIRRILGPNYEAVAPLRTKINNQNERNIVLTEQQYSVLDELQRCWSAIIHGPAGTGKTLLAVEMAKRKAYGTNNKVALITYNLLLTDFLKL